MNTHPAIGRSPPPPPPPPGFLRWEIPGGFIGANGPLYLRHEADGPEASIALGLRILPKHGNPTGVCHGGMLMAFADILLAVTARHADPALGMLATVSMSSDFLAPARVGEFLIGSGRLLKRTRNLAFADGHLEVEGRLVLRASGVLKIPSRPAPMPGMLSDGGVVQRAPSNADAPPLPGESGGRAGEGEERE